MADERVILNLECSFYAGWNVHLDLDLNRRQLATPWCDSELVEC
jgi:hypothetical protein